MVVSRYSSLCRPSWLSTYGCYFRAISIVAMLFTICDNTVLIAADRIQSTKTLAQLIQDSEATEQQIANLINQLGNDDYQIRLQAEQQLRNVGGKAIDALRRAHRAGETEIRFRARRLLVEVVRADYKKRLDSFLASTDPGDSFGMNGWNKFSAISGDDKYARRLFVGMQNSATDLFLAWDQPQHEFRSQVEAAARGQRNSNMSRIHTVAAAMLGQIQLYETPASGQNPGIQETLSRKLRRTVGLASINQVGKRLIQFETAKLIETSGYQMCFSRLVTRWLRMVPDDSDQLLIKLQIVANLGLTDFVQSALMAILSGETPANDLATAISIIANSGDESQIPVLEQLLENASSCASIRDFRNADNWIQIQVRDVALAALVFLTKQPFANFGFEAVRNDKEDTFVSIEKCWFLKEQTREYAISKWRDSRGLAKTTNTEETDSNDDK